MAAGALRLAGTRHCFPREPPLRSPSTSKERTSYRVQFVRFCVVATNWSSVKALLGRAAAHTREALADAIRAALQAITPQDARVWYTH